jgi:NitT/TauT family transport system permease protein
VPRTLLKLLLPALTGLVVLAIWQAVHEFLSDEMRFLLPSPGAVLQALVDHRSTLWRATLNTTEGALLGFGLAVAVSILLALALSLSPLVRTSLYPYLMALQMTPLPVLAPICVIWVGAGLRSVALLTFVIAFFPLVVNTTQGLISTDRNLVELFRLYRARPWQRLFLLQIAATIAPIGAVVADMNAGSSAGDGGGLGFQAVIFASQARYPALFATAATTCLLGFVLNAAVLALAWLSLHHWHDSYERADH